MPDKALNFRYPPEGFEYLEELKKKYNEEKLKLKLRKHNEEILKMKLQLEENDAESKRTKQVIKYLEERARQDYVSENPTVSRPRNRKDRFTTHKLLLCC